MNYWQICETISIFGATIIGFICFNKSKSDYCGNFVYMLTVQSIAEVALYLFNDNFPDAILVRIIYCPMLFLNYLFYFKSFSNRFNYSNYFKIYLRISLMSYCIYSVYLFTMRLIDKSSAGDSFLILSILLIILMLNYFWKLISSKEVIFLKKEPLFWIATGTLFYYTGNIVATGFFHRLYNSSKELAKVLYKLNHVLAIALYILCSIAFILSTKTNSKDV